MRELHNGYLMVMMLIIITFLLTTGCQSRTIELLDGLCFNDKDGTYVCDECMHIERYEFDTPGIEAHEVKTKKDCIGRENND